MGVRFHATCADARPVQGAIPQQLRYAGYWYDSEVQWYWLSVRYYDPEEMRFLQPDPSDEDGVHTYAYVGDDPVDASDPSGLCLILLHSETVQFSGITPKAGYHTYITTTENTTRVWGRLAKLPESRLSGPDGARHRTYVFEGKNQGSYIGATLATRPENGGANSDAFTDSNVPRKGQDIADRKREQTIIDNAKSCACYNSKFRSIANEINQIKFPYNFLGTNSNAVTYTLLYQSGLPAPNSPYALKSGRYAPGLGIDLIDIYNQYYNPFQTA